jgi:hypothetical protein
MRTRATAATPAARPPRRLRCGHAASFLQGGRWRRDAVHALFAAGRREMRAREACCIAFVIGVDKDEGRSAQAAPAQARRRRVGGVRAPHLQRGAA